MSIPLTAARLQAMYECLRQFPPFCTWALPHGSEVAFHVTRHKDRHGDYYLDGKHHIRVSANFIGAIDSLTRVMAHEMVHLKVGVKHSAHGAEFKRCARSVCRRFQWDEKIF